MRFLIRGALWLAAHTVLKVRIVGHQNIPAHGPALLASNHISYADGFVIGYCVKPLVRFMTWAPLFRVPGVAWVLYVIKAIPTGADSRQEIVESILTARQDLVDCHIVCIFPEGSMTRNGELHPFRRGMEKIAEFHRTVFRTL